RHGYTQRTDPVFIQSFEVGNLAALRAITPLRLIQLVDAHGAPADRPQTPYASMMSAAGLADIAQYADGIGPAKDMVLARDGAGRLAGSTGLVAAAHHAGLAVHPWTFRAENYFLPANLRIAPAGDAVADAAAGASAHGDLAAEIRAFVDEGVDGLFADYPAIAAQVVAAMGGR
ncbi:MAG: glycerophosphodiester phosphodiesterase family protein, partial [Sphingopyxis sp.]